MSTLLEVLLLFPERAIVIDQARGFDPVCCCWNGPVNDVFNSLTLPDQEWLTITAWVPLKGP